jgi:hypothetical protein
MKVLEAGKYQPVTVTDKEGNPHVFTHNSTSNKWEETPFARIEGKGTQAKTKETPLLDAVGKVPDDAIGEDIGNAYIKAAGGNPGARGVVDEAEKIADGRKRIPTDFALKDERNRASYELAMRMNHQLDQTTYEGRVKSIRDFSPGGVAGKQVSQSNTTIQHMLGASDRIQELGNGWFQPWNYLVNQGQSMTGYPQLKRFRSAVSDYTAELGKLLKMGVLSQHEHDEMVSAVGSSGFREQLNGVLADQAERLAGRIYANTRQRDNTIGTKTKLPPLLEQDSMDALKIIYKRGGRGTPDEFGRPPREEPRETATERNERPELASSATRTATDPTTGRRVGLINNAWIYLDTGEPAGKSRQQEPVKPAIKPALPRNAPWREPQIPETQ